MALSVRLNGSEKDIFLTPIFFAFTVWCRVAFIHPRTCSYPCF